MTAQRKPDVAAGGLIVAMRWADGRIEHKPIPKSENGSIPIIDIGGAGDEAVDAFVYPPNADPHAPPIAQLVFHGEEVQPEWMVCRVPEDKLFCPVCAGTVGSKCSICFGTGYVQRRALDRVGPYEPPTVRKLDLSSVEPGKYWKLVEEDEKTEPELRLELESVLSLGENDDITENDGRRIHALADYLLALDLLSELLEQLNKKDNWTEAGVVERNVQKARDYLQVLLANAHYVAVDTKADRIDLAIDPPQRERRGAYKAGHA